MRTEYWDEAVRVAFDDAGITATEEQILQVAGSIATSHDCYGMAYPGPGGYGPDTDSRDIEIKRLKRELEAERNKWTCPTCKGKGELVIAGPYHSAVSDCWDCRGAGRK